MFSQYLKPHKNNLIKSAVKPMALAVALALTAHPVLSQAAVNHYEYLGKWVPDTILPSNPPFLEGSLIQRNTSGQVTSTKSFTYSEDFNGNVISPYGFREGQDWGFLWNYNPSLFPSVYEQNKEMFDRYGITPDNSVSPNQLVLESSLLGASGKTTRIYVPGTFNGKDQQNRLCIVLPVVQAADDGKVGQNLINGLGTYNFDSPISSVGWGNSGKNEHTSTGSLINFNASQGTQTVNLGDDFGKGGSVLDNYVAYKDAQFTPQGNVLFMSAYARRPAQNAVSNQRVTGNVGIISTASDRVPGSVILFKEDGWHLDAANIVMAGATTFPRVPHNTHGIIMYGGGMANNYSHFAQRFSGNIQSLGTTLQPLGIGVLSELDQAAANKKFIQEIGKIEEIHAVSAGIVNDIKANTFDASQEQNIRVGKIEVFGDGTFRGAFGVYNRTNMGGNNNSNNAVQRIYLDDSIVVDGFSTQESPHQYIQVVSTFAAVANRGGRQEIISTNPDCPILLSAKTQMKSERNEEDRFGAYAVLVYPNYQTAPKPEVRNVSFTETTLKGSFDVYNGDIAVFGEQSGRFSKSVGLRLEGQLYAAADGKPERISNRLSIADGNNIVITDRSPLKKNSKPSTITAPNEVRAFLQLRPTVDSNGIEHPYEIEFKGEHSYLNVEGAYLGNGTLIFHSGLAFRGDDKWTSRSDFIKENNSSLLESYKEDLFKRWTSGTAEEKAALEEYAEFKEDAAGDHHVLLTEKGLNAHNCAVEKAYKEIFEQGNQLVVNKNPVIIHKVVAQEKTGEASRLNLQIDTSNLRKEIDAAYPGVGFASEQPKIQKYFDENAIYILRQAANNVFIHEWTDEKVLLPHQTVLAEQTGSDKDGHSTKITEDHDKFLEVINPVTKELEKKEEKKSYQLSDGTLVEQVITTQKIATTNNRFTGQPVNKTVAGKVSFTIPEGIITPQRTYVTEYYVENKDNYDPNNPYGFNDNAILHQFLAEYERDKYGKEFNSKLDVMTSQLAPSEPLKSAEQLRKEEAESANGISAKAVAQAEDTKEGNRVEDDGITNMGEVYGKVETYVTTVDEKLTPPDDCTKYGNCAPEDPDDNPENGNPGSWEEVTPPTKPDGSIDVGNGCSTSTMDTLDSIGLTNYFLWRQENETLYQRMGEVRDNYQLEGLWFRGIAGKNEWNKGRKFFENKYYGIQVGIDRVHQTYTDEYKCRELDGEYAPCKRVLATDWIYGLGFTYMKGNSKLANGGSGDNWIGSISLYGVRKFKNGGYLDLIAKASKLNNEFTAISDQFRYISQGKYHTYAFQLSAEYGNKHYLNKAKTWYLDPEVQLTYGYIKGVKYRTFNALNVDVHNLSSLIGRAGIALGKEAKNGSVFLKVDALREFSGTYKARYHLDHGAWNKSRISMKDAWGEVTIGGTYNFKKDSYGFIQAKKSFAADLKQHYRFDAGIRFVF